MDLNQRARSRFTHIAHTQWKYRKVRHSCVICGNEAIAFWICIFQHIWLLFLFLLCPFFISFFFSRMCASSLQVIIFPVQQIDRTIFGVNWHKIGLCSRRKYMLLLCTEHFHLDAISFFSSKKTNLMPHTHILIINKSLSLLIIWYVSVISWSKVMCTSFCSLSIRNEFRWKPTSSFFSWSIEWCSRNANRLQRRKQKKWIKCKNRLLVSSKLQTKRE